MKLEELLEEATPRPWGKYLWKEMAFFLIEKMTRTTSGKHAVFAEDRTAKQAKIDMDLARHAVNNLEGLLEAAKAAAEFISSKVGYEQDDATIAESFNEDEKLRVLVKAIRQAEEVKE